MRNSKTRSVALFRLLLIALALLVIPPKALAGLDGSQFHKSYNYQINLSGTNSIKLKFPCGGDGHNFSTSDKSKLYFKLSGQSDKTQLMELHSKQGTKDDASQKGKFMYFWFEFNWNCAYNHTLQLTSGTEKPVTFTKDGGVNVAKALSDNVYWIEMEFRVPQSWCGQRVEFEWSVYSSDNGSDKIKIDVATVDVPDAPEGLDPELTQATLMPNDIGKIGYMWYISARDVTKATTLAAGKYYESPLKMAKVSDPNSNYYNAENVGKVIGDDGNVYATNAIPNVITAVAKIVYVGTASTAFRGLAVALSDETQAYWGTAVTAAAGKASPAAPTGCTWFLPTVLDWQHILASGVGLGLAKIGRAHV